MRICNMAGCIDIYHDHNLNCAMDGPFRLSRDTRQVPIKDSTLAEALR